MFNWSWDDFCIVLLTPNPAFDIPQIGGTQHKSQLSIAARMIHVICVCSQIVLKFPKLLLIWWCSRWLGSWICCWGDLHLDQSRPCGPVIGSAMWDFGGAAAGGAAVSGRQGLHFARAAPTDVDGQWDATVARWSHPAAARWSLKLRWCLFAMVFLIVDLNSQNVKESWKRVYYQPKTFLTDGATGVKAPVTCKVWKQSHVKMACWRLMFRCLKFAERKCCWLRLGWLEN